MPSPEAEHINPPPAAFYLGGLLIFQAFFIWSVRRWLTLLHEKKTVPSKQGLSRREWALAGSRIFPVVLVKPTLTLWTLQENLPWALWSHLTSSIRISLSLLRYKAKFIVHLNLLIYYYYSFLSAILHKVAKIIPQVLSALFHICYPEYQSTQNMLLDFKTDIAKENFWDRRQGILMGSTAKPFRFRGVLGIY